METSILRKSFIALEYEPNDPTMATSTKKSLKNRLRNLSNFLAIIPKLRKEENLCWSWREETAPDMKTEMLEFSALSGSRSQVNVKFGLVTSVVEKGCQWN